MRGNYYIIGYNTPPTGPGLLYRLDNCFFIYRILHSDKNNLKISSQLGEPIFCLFFIMRKKQLSKINNSSLTNRF